jgi:hypothetical protein
MDINPIPYSAFVKEDNSIQKLIEQLSALQDKYVELLKVVKADASTTKTSLSAISAATKEGQDVINVAALGVQRLKRLHEELKLAFSEVGREIAKYKDRLASVNKENALNAKIILANDQSLKQLKGELGLLVKKYEELSAEERINGAATQELIDRIIFLRQEIKNITANITLQTKASRTQAAANDAVAKATDKLIKAYSNETNELFRIKRETDEVLKIKRLEARAADGTTNSYNRLAAQYELNMINLNKYSQEVINLSPFLKRQQEESKKMRLEMIRLKEATGNHALSVGNYTKAWNGLGMATQQVVRELPALAISAQTFFIAISNNVPILADEIKNLIRQNKEAAKIGRETTSVWKQLAKSLFSWQTLLVLGLTVLSLYGSKIIDWISNLGGADNALKKVTKTHTEFLKSLKDGNNEYTNAIESITRLNAIFKNIDGVYLTAKDALEEYNKTLGNAFGHAEDLATAQQNIVDKSDAYIDVMFKMAMANAYLEQMSKSSAEAVALAANTQITWWDRMVRRLTGEDVRDEKGRSMIIGSKEWIDKVILSERQEKAEKIKAQGKAFYEAYLDGIAEAYKAAEAAGIDLFPDLSKDPKDPKAPKGPSDLSIENENIKIRRQYLQSVRALERDHLEKQRKELVDAFNIEIQTLRNKQKNEERLTKKSRDLIDEIMSNSYKKLLYDLELLDIEYQQRQLNLEKEGLDLRLSLMERGTVQYYAIRNALLRNQMEYELLENRKQVESLRKDEQAIRDKYGYDILQNEIAMDDLFFEQAQKYQQSEFDLVRHSEYEKNKFRLQQEKDMWTRRLEMAKSGLLTLTALEKATIENILEMLDRQLDELNAGRDLFDLVGLDLDNEQKSAIKEATSFVMDNIGDMIDAEIRLAEIKLEKAREQVDRAYDFLQLEMEARNQGYANNVETANKELQLARETEAKALEQKKKAQLAQERLNTIEQASSLITASANIWKTFSTLGPFGIPAAVSAIALMFGSFLGAKIKAKQVISTETEEYAEGHVELLEGGSHKSGKDIPLGKTSKGKERRAEGGEILAVVNKRSVAKYGASKIFDIVNSVNKGIFEDKYTNIFNVANHPINTYKSDIDLMGIDSNVKAIREQNEYRYYSDGAGLLIERYKNRTRTFKRK